ncbi:MAG: hypothetical protein EXR77_09690, partial [Myxococcales bacterium]|nr:hypothetical protein [Myxococcales bacterium]
MTRGPNNWPSLLAATHPQGWDFGQGKCTADVAANGFDLLGVSGRIGRWKVEKVLDQKLKPLLPQAVQQAGYSPNRDPDITGTIAKMQKTFAFTGAGASGAAGDAGAMAAKLSAPSPSLDVSMPEDFIVPLGDSGLQLIIARSTPIDLSAQAAGKASQPLTETLSLRLGARRKSIGYEISLRLYTMNLLRSDSLLASQIFSTVQELPGVNPCSFGQLPPS